MHMKRKIIAIELCMIMIFGMLTGCGEVEMEDSTEPFVLEKFLSDLGNSFGVYSTSKEAYLDDIMAIMEIIGFMGYIEADPEDVLTVIEGISVSTKEGNETKDSMVKMWKMSIEVVELSMAVELLKITDSATDADLVETNEQIDKLIVEIEKISEETENEKLTELLLAAKEAGVEAEDLKARGIDEWMELFSTE